MLPDPDQNYDHICQPVSGSDGMHDLQRTAYGRVGEFQRGSLVSLNANGEMIPGCPNGAMPMWSIQAFDDLDADFPRGGLGDQHYTAYVATGGYELKTTEFNAVPASAYAINAALVADGASGNMIDGDYLAATHVVGVVSRPVSNDTYGQSVLHFWPVFLPNRA